MPIGIKPPTINDDKGNPLNVEQELETTSGRIKGQSKSLDENGNRYPYGFTPAVDFIVNPNNIDPETGIPIELGIYRNDQGKVGTDPNEKLSEIVTTYGTFGDTSGLAFLHGYDNDENGTPRVIGLNSKVNKELYLASFTDSGNDNEDPTVYGYDLIIDIDNSPLFNGAIIDFINKFSMIDEVASRLQIYTAFVEKFFNYFNNIYNQANKAHYLKSITGLDKLTESNTPEKTSAFTEYRKDMITMTLYEDVTMGMGELVHLYKMLGWSKRNGKSIIPENLLRFEAELVVTEVRKFNRIVKMVNNVDNNQANQDNPTDYSDYLNFDDPTSGATSDTDRFFTAASEGLGNLTDNNQASDTNPTVAMYQLADLLSKYRYKLYECQFYFPKMPHGDTLDMWNPTRLENFEIMFDYKYSTLKLEKFTWSENIPTATIYDNGLYNPTELSSQDSNGSVDDNGNITNSPKEYEVGYVDSWLLTDTKSKTPDQLMGSVESQFQMMKKNLTNDINNQNNLSSILNKLKNAAFAEVNRQILNKARLINRSIDNIRNSVGLGRMSEPTNVYQEDYARGNMLPSAAKNAVRDFLGQSIRNIL